MGCLWSREGREHCTHCNRKAVNDLVIIDHVCEICITRATRSQHSTQRGAKFGEYRCSSCKRYWNSRLCWPDKYQMCKRCHLPTLPYQCRDLCITDMMNSNEDRQEHEHAKELCEMCQQLGYSCKNFGKKIKSSSTNLTSTKIKHSYYITRTN